MAAPATPTTIQFVQAQPFTLSGSGSSIGDVTITLQSMVGIDGTTIVTADLGSFAYGTLEPGNGTQEEAVVFTGITQNANGTATLTGVSSLSFKQPYTLTSGLTKTHAGNSKLVLSNDAAFYNNLVLYMNSIAGAGAANASTTVKGIVEIATAAEIDAGTGTGSTGAVLSVSPDNFASSSKGKYLASVTGTGIPYAVATGTAAAYTATLASSISTLASGTSLNFLVPTTNATGVTLNINGLGAKSLRKNGTASLASGDIVTGQEVTVVFDGTVFQITSPTRASGISYANGNTTHDIAVTGSQTIAHGLGAIPANIIIKSSAATIVSGQQGIAWSDGSYNGSQTGCVSYTIAFANSGTSNFGQTSNGGNATYIITLNVDTSGGHQAQASVAVDATNITLTWSKSNFPTGSAYIFWQANT